MAVTVMNTFALCGEASIDATFAEQIGADGLELMSLDEQDHKKLRETQKGAIQDCWCWI
jgi:hypothetical protein